MARLRFRYRIRTLLALMVLVGGLCYYALLPWTNAKRFMNAVRNGDTAAATDMLRGHHWSGPHSAAIQAGYEMHVAQVTLQGIWNGEAMVVAHVPEEADMPGGTWFLATRRGIVPGPITW